MMKTIQRILCLATAMLLTCGMAAVGLAEDDISVPEVVEQTVAEPTPIEVVGTPETPEAPAAEGEPVAEEADPNEETAVTEEEEPAAQEPDAATEENAPVAEEPEASAETTEIPAAETAEPPAGEPVAFDASRLSVAIRVLLNQRAIGERVTLQAELSGFEGCTYACVWQYRAEGGDWQNVPDADNGERYEFLLDEENATWSWRVVVTLLSAPGL